jgi:hypothetical protein
MLEARTGPPLPVVQVWGLWLSSLVVGYGLLLTGIFTPVLRGDPSGWGMGQDRPPDRAQRAPSPALRPGRRWIVRLFELPVAIHGVFLSLFFPAANHPPTEDLHSSPRTCGRS